MSGYKTRIILNRDNGGYNVALKLVLSLMGKEMPDTQTVRNDRLNIESGRFLGYHGTSLEGDQVIIFASKLTSEGYVHINGQRDYVERVIDKIQEKISLVMLQKSSLKIEKGLPLKLK